MAKQTKTSWETSSKWYDSSVKEKGHYYHQQVILPKLLALMDLKKGDRVLDVGCGQGVLERQISKEINYLGIDLSKSLISAAKKRVKHNTHKFLLADASTFDLPEKNFSHAALILSLQNMENPKTVLTQVGRHLQPQGKLFLVLNHPCFRIPRQSHWEIDEEKKLMYRRMDSYLSKMKIPIQTHPGKAQDKKTWSFHFPLSSYFSFLHESGFVISHLEEWISDKKSTGKRSQMENRARNEFPLFMALVAIRIF